MAESRVTYGKTERTKVISGLLHHFQSVTEVRVDGERVGAIVGTSEHTTNASAEVGDYKLMLDDREATQVGGVYQTVDTAKKNVRTALNRKLRDG